MQVGGGVHADNAAEWLDAGASHVIVTSYIFPDGQLSQDRLQQLVRSLCCCTCLAVSRSEPLLCSNACCSTHEQLLTTVLMPTACQLNLLHLEIGRD